MIKFIWFNDSLVNLSLVRTISRSIVTADDCRVRLWMVGGDTILMLEECFDSQAEMEARFERLARIVADGDLANDGV